MANARQTIVRGSSSSSPSRVWEDDAWKIDSDDEDFVKASRTGGRGGGGGDRAGSSASAEASLSRLSLNTANGSAGGHGKYAGGGGGGTRGNDSSSSIAASNDTSRAAKPQRHAPPARPHPYPTGASSSSSYRSDRSGLAAEDARRGSSSANGNRKSIDAASSDNRVSVSPDKQWTLVERSGSVGSARTAAVEEGSLQDDEEAAARSAKASREARQKAMMAAIQDDLNQVLHDPMAMLARPSIRADSGHGARSPSARRKVPTVTSPSSDVPSSPARSLHSATGFDTSNAVVAVDGIVTTLPASSDHFDASTLNIPGRDAVVLTDVGIERRNSIRSERRKAGFIKCLHEDLVRMDDLRTLAWAGIPDDLRPMVWMLLLGYLPANRSFRTQTLARKRAEYASGVRNAFQRGTEELDQAIWHQIHIDVPRTNPGITLWQRAATQRALERILYVWAIRHPASGYVQGINDLATPFFEVFLSAYISTDPEQYDVALLPPNVLEALEADTFWCLSKLLDGIQDNYIFAQPGIQRQVRRMGELVSRINPSLHAHFEEQSVEYMQFAFRWMNCLLMRELSVRNIVRMWDSYLAEGPNAFADFHLFVCAAFLDRWSDELRKMDFQGIIMFLQSLPTQDWTAKETELLLADAFVKKSLFGGTAHLTN